MPSWTPHSLNPSQSSEGQYSGTNLLLFQVGSSLYYVTSAQVGLPSGDETYNIWIQKSVSGGPWSQVYNGPLGTNTFCVVLVGTVFYIFGEKYGTNNDLYVFRFDTATDTMLDLGTDSGFAYNSHYGISASAYSNGQILVCCYTNTAPTLTGLVYTPTTNTFGAPFTIDSTTGQGVFAQVTDTSIDVAFVFYLTGSDLVIKCCPVSNPATVGTPVTAATLTLSGNITFTGGTPCLSSGHVLFPYIDPSNSSPTAVLYVARAVSSFTPVFTAEVVENTIPWPACIYTLDADWWFGFALCDESGTAYLFYERNVNDLDNSSSQTSILYRSSTAPGVWSSQGTAWTGPVPSSSMALYPRALSTGGIGIIEAYADPTVFFGPHPSDKYASLSVIYLDPGGISMVCPSSSATGGVAYSGTVTVSGGTAPYTFAIIAGSLPPGLSLNTSTGVISGTPTTPGVYPYTVRVTDSLGLTGTISCSITVPSMPVACPPGGTLTVGSAYSGSLTVSGGTAPYTFALISGPLPPGLSLNTSTGVISGTATTAGSYPYTVKATDTHGLTGSVSCLIAVSQAAAGPPKPGDVEFILRRLYVSMIPNKRVPVRGR